jgi:chaperonin GroEL
VLKKLARGENDDFDAGLDILYEALSKPAKAIADNAGFDGDVISHRALQDSNPNWGFDSMTGEHVDMLKSGIVDPAKVTKAALQNAVSVAQLLLTTDALIATKPESKKKGGPPEGGMEGMDEMGGGGMDF